MAREARWMEGWRRKKRPEDNRMRRGDRQRKKLRANKNTRRRRGEER